MLQFKSVKKEGEPGGVYARVLNAEGAALSRGEVVEWDTDSAIGYSVEEVDSATPLHVAGVVEDTSIANAAYGFIQIYGLHDAVLTNTTVSAGTAVSADTESSVGKAVAHSQSTDAAADIALGIFGVSLAVVDTNSAKIFIRCM